MAITWPTQTQYTDRVGDVLYGEPIQAVDRAAIIAGANHVSGQRVNQLLSASWMTDLQTGTRIDAAVQGVLLGPAYMPTHDWVTWWEWETLADDAIVTLEIATDLAMTTNLKTFVHTHPVAGALSRRRTAVGVEPNFGGYFVRVSLLDGKLGGPAEMGTIQIVERPLNGSDLSMYTPEYADVAAAVTDGIVGGDVFTVNGRLLYMRPGESMEYPAIGGTPDDIAVPYEYRDADVIAVYDASVAWNAGVNAAWNWNHGVDAGPLGTIGVAADETTLDTVAGGAGGQSWLWPALAVALAGQTLVHIYGEVTAGTVAGAQVVRVADASLNEDYYLYGTQGAPRSYRWSAAVAADAYLRGAGRWRQQLLCDGVLDTEAEVEFRDYEQQVVAIGHKSSAFGAIGGDSFQIGDPTADANLSTTVIKGFPAIAIFVRR